MGLLTDITKEALSLSDEDRVVLAQRVWESMILLCVVDLLIPLPFIGAVPVYLVAQRPPWFVYLVNRIYSS